MENKNSLVPFSSTHVIREELHLIHKVRGVRRAAVCVVADVSKCASINI